MSKKILKKLNATQHLFNQSDISEIPQSLDLKDRLKYRINKMRHNRNGLQAQDNMDQKRKQHIQDKIDKLTGTDNEIVIEKSDSIKKYSKKLKELEKKHGQISFDYYIANLNILNTVSFDDKSGSRSHAQNIVNLYIKQQQNHDETMLELSDDEEGNGASP